MLEAIVIRVVAVITAKPGRRDELVEFFHANRPAVLAEAGCVEYQGVVDADWSPAKYGPDVFAVIETWETAEALKAHSIAPHMVAYGRNTKALIADRAIHVLSPV